MQKQLQFFWIANTQFMKHFTIFLEPRSKLELMYKWKIISVAAVHNINRGQWCAFDINGLQGYEMHYVNAWLKRSLI